LSGLTARLRTLDPSLSGALENARRKIAYQFEQLAERARKAVERRGDVEAGRHQRLERLLMPSGVPYERIFPPLTPMLAWGDGVRDALRRAAGDSTRGAAIVDVGLDGGAPHGG
jgi:uncharacterized protein YllA (UPF0747 family)